MLKTTLLSFGLLAIVTPFAFANPETIPIDQAFKQTHKLSLSKEVDYYLDFSDTRYRVIGAIPSNPQEFRAVRLSSNEQQELILRWTPTGSAPKASIAVRVMSPSGDEKSITFKVQRTGKDPDNIKTVFTPSQAVSKDAVIGEAVKVPIQPAISSIPSQLIRTNWNTQNPPKTAQAVKPPLTPSHPKSPDVVQLRDTPKPISRIAKVSTTGRTLIDRSTLDHKALANYLLRGLHRARGLRQINRHHDNYWFAQSMARYLKRGVSVDKALKWSRLPEKTFNDLLGHGGVSR